ncbi:6-pyruvoyl trahydropterin synthase family protein [Nocardiopsis sp. LOL_012]|uniref:6-pyruvoyl trahydropterin synthase family protein n=1 Tax=Nocardiopsis sp. LOL_012 TaxID=3345409 RepID=UPI003A8B589D
MGYRIGKSFSFDAAHFLSTLPSGHKCSRLHGHTYTVTVELVSLALAPPGFVTDFGDLAPFAAYLDEQMDHRLLNDALDAEPTSELLARHMGEWFIAHVEPGLGASLSAVTVAESPTSWARWEVER